MVGFVNTPWSLAYAAGYLFATLLAAGGMLPKGSRAAELERDWDIRCCLQRQDLAHPFFIIELHGTAYPVGNLFVTTPTGATIGFDPAMQAFHRPVREGLYALGPRPQPRTDAPTWNHDRYVVLLRQRLFAEGRITYQSIYQPKHADGRYTLAPGIYTVRVIGIAAGVYTLRFYPFGLDAGAAAEFSAVRITAGEQHEYVFEGEAVAPIVDKPPVKAAPLAVERVR